MLPALISREPAFDVMISTTWRKSALRPLLSVSVAWSITCSRMLKMSGCAFSISSSSSTAYGMLADRVDEQAALLEADVAGRRADQPRDGVLLHVLAHVEADELVAEMHRQLLGELGLADAGRAGEEEAAGRAIGLAEAGARALDRARDGAHGLFLAEHHAAERLLERPQPIACRTTTPAWRECAPCARRPLRSRAA